VDISSLGAVDWSGTDSSLQEPGTEELGNIPARAPKQKVLERFSRKVS